MLMLKVCHACDYILGELEIDDDLTRDNPDSIIEIVGSVAYTLCPDCLRLLEVEPDPVYH